MARQTEIQPVITEGNNHPYIQISLSGSTRQPEIAQIIEPSTITEQLIDGPIDAQPIDLIQPDTVPLPSPVKFGPTYGFYRRTRTFIPERCQINELASGGDHRNPIKKLVDRLAGRPNSYSCYIDELRLRVIVQADNRYTAGIEAFQEFERLIAPKPKFRLIENGLPLEARSYLKP
jgi:hypothetical protein